MDISSFPSQNCSDRSSLVPTLWLTGFEEKRDCKSGTDRQKSQYRDWVICMLAGLHKCTHVPRDTLTHTCQCSISHREDINTQSESQTPFWLFKQRHEDYVVSPAATQLIYMSRHDYPLLWHWSTCTNSWPTDEGISSLRLLEKVWTKRPLCKRRGHSITW